ncbi:NDP-sugar synthase, partial [Shimia sp.]|uniref:nucleotidyltransferase family protein n=1 Tax=Shimia sp. TaxID=1954381 RepID=UPI00356705C7
MLTNHEEVGNLTVLHAATNRMTSADMGPLCAARDRMLQQGRSAMLVDLGGVRQVARSGLAALTEFACSFGPGTRVGFFGARGPVAAALADCPLTAALPCFASRQQALADPGFRALQLAGTRALLLCAGAGSRMAPLTARMPKPMLDILGRPVLGHLMRHLGG